MSRARRRSSKKSANRGVPWGKIIAILAVVLVLAGFLSVFLAKSWFRSYLRSPELAAKIEKKLGVMLKAEPQMDLPQWTGQRVFCNRFHAIGGEGAFFSEMDLEAIRLDVNLKDIRDGVVELPVLQADRGELTITEARIGTVPEPDPPVTGLAARYAPKKVEFDEARIETLDFDYNKGGTRIQINRTAAVLRPQAEAGALDIEGRGGTLHLPGQEPMEINRLMLRVRKAGIFIQHLELAGNGDALFEGDGEIHFGKSGRFETSVNLRELEVEDLVEDRWKGRVKGKAKADLVSEAKFDDQRGVRHSGSFEIDGGVLRDLPVLEKLAEHTKDDRFLELDLSEAKGDFKRVGDHLQIRNLEIQKDSLLRLTGDADLRGNVIDGTFEVGVARTALRWIPGAEKKVFTEERDGFVWTSLRVTGPLNAPQEDLSARLRRGAVETVVEETAGAAIDNAGAVAGKGAGIIEGVGNGLLRGVGVGPVNDSSSAPTETTGADDASKAGTGIGDAVIGVGVDAAKGVVGEGAKGAGVLSDFVPLLP